MQNNGIGMSGLLTVPQALSRRCFSQSMGMYVDNVSLRVLMIWYGWSVWDGMEAREEVLGERTLLDVN